jgi:hypothetical protein
MDIHHTSTDMAEGKDERQEQRQLMKSRNTKTNSTDTTEEVNKESSTHVNHDTKAT